MDSIIKSKKKTDSSIKNQVKVNSIDNGIEERDIDIKQIKKYINSNKVIKETGTIFEINKKDSSIIITSSEEVKVNIQSLSNIIIMHIEKSDNSTLMSTEITVSGFNNTIYKYEDERLTSDRLIVSDDGKVHFVQDISTAHTVFLQIKKSTIFLNETTGWSQPVGTWDPKTRIAKLTVPVINDGIVINTDYVVLDGLQNNNLKCVISGVPIGIAVIGKQNITIKNIDIENCDIGIYIDRSDYVYISKNTVNDCSDIGIFAEYGNRNINVNNNLITNIGFVGIGVYEENLYIDIQNNIVNSVQNAIRFYGSNKEIKIISNTISIINYIPGDSYIYGIYFESTNNDDILIEKNTIEIISNNITDNYFVICGIYFEDDYDNFINVLNNYVTISGNSIKNVDDDLYFYLEGIGLENDYSGNAVVNNNKVTVENNVISVVNNFAIYDEIYGIHPADEDTGNYKCELNQIKVNGNIISPYSGNTATNYIIGIYLEEYNLGINLKNNYIEVSNNITNGVNDKENIVSGIYFYEYNGGWLIESNKINIQNNNMGAQGECVGIYFYYENFGNLISNNIIKILNNTGITLRVYGIYFKENNYGSKILNNTISNNQGTAIYLEEDNSGNTIKKNKISNNDESGIYFEDGNIVNVIEDNIINNNKLYGIYFYSNNYNNDIISNSISSNSLDGIYFYEYDYENRIIDNIISKNANGIYLNDSSDEENNLNKIECNSIEYNSAYGIFVGTGNNNNIIKNNTISKNLNGLFIKLNAINTVIKYNNFIKGTGYNAYDQNALGVNSFYSNYWSNWNGVVPYYVNGVIGGPEDPNPSKSRLNKCRQYTPIIKAKPIKMPYKCNNYKKNCGCEECKKSCNRELK